MVAGAQYADFEALMFLENANRLSYFDRSSFDRFNKEETMAILKVFPNIKHSKANVDALNN